MGPVPGTGGWGEFLIVRIRPTSDISKDKESERLVELASSRVPGRMSIESVLL